jgi:uncharacterized protein YdgA (DUF945 family)
LPEFKAEIKEKHEGLFSTSVVTQVSIQSEPGVLFLIKQTQSYGPLLFTDEGIKLGLYFLNTDLIPGDLIKKELPADLNIEDLFDIHFLSGFSGSVQGDLYFKGLDFTDNQTRISLSPAEIHLDTDLSFEKIVGFARWPGMSAAKGDQQDGVFINGVSFDFNQNLVAGDLLSGSAIYEGEGTYAIEEMVFKEGRNFFKMENFKVKGVADLATENSMDMAIEMSSNQLNVAGEVYSDNTLNLYFKGLDIKLLQQIGEISQNMQTAAFEGQDVNAYNMQLMNAMMQLIQKGPSFELKNTQVRTEHGPIIAAAKVTIDKDKLDPNNPMAMMFAIDALFDAEAPEAYFANKGMQGMIDQWAQMNFLVKDNGTLKINASMQDGMTLLNGQPMPM